MIRVDNIRVAYERRAVLDGVSFDLADGNVLALLGANGAGKTTLVRSLNRTVPLSLGEILFDERPLNGFSRREIAHRVAVVAQENETRFPVTVLEFVLSGRFVHGGALGWETDADVDAANKALADCDLTEYSSRLMNELSGGERQRVVLARALATNAKVLLLDEPTANLDLAHQAMMFRLVRERCDRDGASAVVITHDLNLAATFADEVLMLKDGRVAANGAPSEVLTAENVRKVFDVDVMLDAHPVTGGVRVTSLF